MPEAPLEALARLEHRLVEINELTPATTADVEDAVSAVRDLVRQLEDAGAPVYSEADLLRFIRAATQAADLSVKQAAIRLSEKVLRLESDWIEEMRGYALACASLKNWTLLAAVPGSAFERLETVRGMMREQRAQKLLANPGDPMQLAQREMAWAFLEFTAPASIAGWLRGEDS